MSKFGVLGAEVLIKALKKNANLDDVKNVVKMNGSEMQGKMQRGAAVDTGTMKRSIKYESLDNGFTAKVAPSVNYASYVEYGTRYNFPQPFVRPSFHDQKEKFKRDLDRLMK